MSAWAKWLLVGVVLGGAVGAGLVGLRGGKQQEAGAPTLSLPGDADQLIKDRDLKPDDVAAALATYQPSGRFDEFVMFASGGHSGQVLVIGVFDSKEKRWARMASDDRRVRRELAEANRYGGKVVVAQSSLGKLSSLNAVIGGLGVTQTPSVVVVDRNRKGVVLTGFVERNAINQAIQDARRNSTERRITHPYVRKLNETCANFDLRLSRFNMPTTRAGARPALRRLERLLSSYRVGFASLNAPARYAPIQRQVTQVLRKGERFAAALRTGSLSQMDAAYTALLASDAGLDRRFAAAGATACVSNRKS